MMKSRRSENGHNPKRGYASRKLNNDGLSLVELIVAILILAIVSASITQVFLAVLKANQVNKSLVGADAVAENILEAVKVRGLK